VDTVLVLCSGPLYLRCRDLDAAEFTVNSPFLAPPPYFAVLRIWRSFLYFKIFLHKHSANCCSLDPLGFRLAATPNRLRCQYAHVSRLSVLDRRHWQPNACDRWRYYDGYVRYGLRLIYNCIMGSVCYFQSMHWTHFRRLCKPG
jgi:hypothetical protein